MGNQEQQNLRNQDAQYNIDGVPDSGPPVPEIDFLKKVPGRQGAGKEHRPDE